MILLTASVGRFLDNRQIRPAEPRQCEPLDKGGSPVPTETIVLIAVIIAIFSVFGAVLAWGDYQTRHLPERK
jgi:hypothetical protein